MQTYKELITVVYREVLYESVSSIYSISGERTRINNHSTLGCVKQHAQKYLE